MRKGIRRRVTGFAVGTLIALSTTSLPAQADVDLSASTGSDTSLLLPAVQKVREALPARTSTSAGAEVELQVSADQGGTVSVITFTDLLVSS
jgi:hypothetical protein